MRLFELFESKPAKKTVKSPAPRNFVAKNSGKAGRAGAHEPKKYTRKEKHKSVDSANNDE